VTKDSLTVSGEELPTEEIIATLKGLGYGATVK
jgi:hypothetical protein